MNAVLVPRFTAPTSVFDLADRAAWLRWRDAKLAARPRGAADLVVEVRDPRHLSQPERAAIVDRCRRTNMAIYASRPGDERPDLALAVACQLGMRTLDANPFAGEDGVARIARDARKAKAGYIPYTSRRMRWHTDGYYNAPSHPVRSMILHCVRPAECREDTALLDPELAWLMLREAGEPFVRALMHPEALTIPERTDRREVARSAVAGPVFSVDAPDGDLLMRYTARRRSVQWRCDAATSEATARLLALMDHDATSVIRTRLEAGMGLVCNNVLHERGAFEDSPASPRLLLRARFRERIAGSEGAWARFAR